MILIRYNFLVLILTLEIIYFFSKTASLFSEATKTANYFNEIFLPSILTNFCSVSSSCQSCYNECNYSATNVFSLATRIYKIYT